MKDPLTLIIFVVDWNTSCFFLEMLLTNGWPSHRCDQGCKRHEDRAETKKKHANIKYKKSR